MIKKGPLKLLGLYFLNELTGSIPVALSSSLPSSPDKARRSLSIAVAFQPVQTNKD